MVGNLSSSFLLSLLIFGSFIQIQAVTLRNGALSAPALIAFGDSIVDPGNNNHLPTIVKCNFAPYGRDFMGGEPTGRFCNGKIPTDLIAEQLGIKDIVPAYLDPNLKDSDLPTGVSFASGGSGYDPLTPKIVTVLGFSDQLNLFKEYIGKLKSYVGEARAADIIKDSLYIVVAGSDDLANTYFTLNARWKYDLNAYTDLMAREAASFVQQLYNMGARRIGVFSAPPIGCVPSQRTLQGSIIRECGSKENTAAMMFNSKLSSSIGELTKTFQGGKATYIDVYTPLLDIINNPHNYGFQVSNKGCCGTGELEVSVLCNSLSIKTCQNASDYVFWDSYHPTQNGYQALVTPLLQKYVKVLLG
ncbi:GDSL esterase/lipase exl3 [Ranunculus cassubicifolius]